MRLTQGAFSFLPDLTDDEIRLQIDYALAHSWPCSIEFTDDPHPRNTYWEMWGLPMFDLVDPAAVMDQVRACREQYPEHYVRVMAYDASLGRQTVALSFLVNRPSTEPGFRLDRAEGVDRRIGYTIHPYATEAPAGSRYRAPDARGTAMSGTETRVGFATSGRSAGVPRPAPDPPAVTADPATPPELAADAVVDLDDVRREAGVDDVLDALDRELVGLAPVKERLRELAALLVVDRVRERFGVAGEAPTLHMCFTGNPGTGKTTVALRLGDLLHGLGYLRRGHLVTATRDDLVGQYVGHTAPKTKEIVGKAIGGVLFVDEAYYLHRPGNERDYGGEAIEILLQAMESHRDDLVVVLAGYADRMESFFTANPGMQSRVAHHVDFPDFTVDELTTIATSMAGERGLRLDDGAGEALREYLALRVEQPWFAGARSVRNGLDRARMRQARRLAEGEGSRVVGLDDLVTLRAADLRASRVFSGGLESAPG